MQPRRSASDKSASRRRTLDRSSPDRSWPRRDTYDQSPPSMVSGRIVHGPSKTDPVSLQPESEAAKNEQRRNRQRRKALLACVEAFSLVPEKSHSSKTTPAVVISDRSESVNRQPTN